MQKAKSRSLNDIVEEQMTKWHHLRIEQKQKTPIPVPASPFQGIREAAVPRLPGAWPKTWEWISSVPGSSSRSQSGRISVRRSSPPWTKRKSGGGTSGSIPCSGLATSGRMNTSATSQSRRYDRQAGQHDHHRPGANLYCPRRDLPRSPHRPPGDPDPQRHEGFEY